MASVTSFWHSRKLATEIYPFFLGMQKNLQIPWLQMTRQDMWMSCLPLSTQAIPTSYEGITLDKIVKLAFCTLKKRREATVSIKSI